MLTHIVWKSTLDRWCLEVTHTLQGPANSRITSKMLDRKCCPYQEEFCTAFSPHSPQTTNLCQWSKLEVGVDVGGFRTVELLGVIWYTIFLL